MQVQWFRDVVGNAWSKWPKHYQLWKQAVTLSLFTTGLSLFSGVNRPHWGRAAFTLRVSPSPLSRSRFLYSIALSLLEPTSTPFLPALGTGSCCCCLTLGDQSGREDIRHDAESMHVLGSMWDMTVREHLLSILHTLNPWGINTISF